MVALRKRLIATGINPTRDDPLSVFFTGGLTGLSYLMPHICFGF
ncbi:MAG TPA: hypothetical protein PLT25_10900 [Acidocella sp.]|nr:hypothetical protein [Acidocella sp.]